MKVTAVIPALDEERGIARTLDELADAMRIGAMRVDAGIDVIVGDNGSRDRTREVALERGARVVDVPRRGYGAACAGALAQLDDDVDVVLFLDADGSDDPAEAAALLAPIVRGEADLVIGARVRRERGALTPQQRAGNALAVFLIARLFGHRYTDLGPFRAIRRSLLDDIGMRDRAYGWTVEMQVRALQLGARVHEVPVSYRRRLGRSKISGTIRGVLAAGWCILSTIARCWWQFRLPAGASGNGAEPRRLWPLHRG